MRSHYRQQKCKVRGSDTHVFRESIKANWDQLISILQKPCPARTMLMSHCGAIPEQCCDFSTDLVEKAIFGHLAAIGPLRGGLSVLG